MPTIAGKESREMGGTDSLRLAAEQAESKWVKELLILEHKEAIVSDT